MTRIFPILFALVIAPTAVFAQGEPEPIDPNVGECETDMDCGPNELCETFEWEACPGCAEPEPGDDPDTCGECTTGSERVCVPAPPPSCDAATPCPGNLVCVTYTFESCSGGGSTPPCEPGESCVDPDPQPEPDECITDTESLCVPPYVAPCQADADCGPGFTCEAQEICECSVGIGGEGEGGDGDVQPEECSCAPTGDMYCQLVEQACETDSECATGLECESFGDAPRCSTLDETDPDPCGDGEPESTSYCVPPDFGYWGYDEGGSTRVADATGNEESNLKSADREGFFGGERDGGKGDVGGCSQTGAGSTPLWLLLLGFGLLRRRRQERPVE